MILTRNARKFETLKHKRISLRNSFGNTHYHREKEMDPIDDSNPFFLYSHLSLFSIFSLSESIHFFLFFLFLTPSLSLPKYLFPFYFIFFFFSYSVLLFSCAHLLSLPFYSLIRCLVLSTQFKHWHSFSPPTPLIISKRRIIFLIYAYTHLFSLLLLEWMTRSKYKAAHKPRVWMSWQECQMP
jgi:hypothetical protein